MPLLAFIRRLKRLAGKSTPVVPVVRLSGAIGTGGGRMGGSMLSLEKLAGPLRKAFRMDGEAVTIIINSPGGAPVQAHLIHDRIRHLASEHDKQVIMAIEDVGASGGYLIACAGDVILAHPSSVVGSIGVVSAGFGFVGAIEKLGIERRVYTSGTRKVSLDPFQPEHEDDVARLKALQEDVHKTFIALVKQRRAGKLNGDDETLFSGEFWSGTRARELGLIDEEGDLFAYLRARFGEKVELPLVNPARRSLFRMLGADAGLAGAGEVLLDRLEERSAFSRFGL